MNTDQNAFFALLRAGLWNNKVRLATCGGINLNEVYHYAEEQSVLGLVAAGVEHLQDIKVPQETALKYAGRVIQIEQRNKAMNQFIGQLFSFFKKNEISAVLVKGQGIAQCYERPLWRESGDIDLIFDIDNYEKAKKVLLPLATDVEQEYTHFKHLCMTIDGWMVELHGTLHSRLSARVDRLVDEVQGDVFYGGKVRSTQNGGAQVFLPAPDENVIFVFTHILHHFFFEGIGLRQICDWCRLLWTYRDKLDVRLLELRLQKAGLMSEWKAFAAFAVNWLGMPAESMPLYDMDKKWKRKAERICRFVMEVGNFGHNQRRDFSGMSYLKRKFVSFWGRLRDMLRHFWIFPLDSIRFFGGVLRSGLHAAVRGE